MIDTYLNNLKFIYASTIQLSWPTECGQTRFVLILHNERIIVPCPVRLI